MAEGVPFALRLAFFNSLLACRADTFRYGRVQFRVAAVARSACSTQSLRAQLREAAL